MCKMWHSEEDFIKDLVFLNDFEVPGDIKSYIPMHSRRKGVNTKEKQKFEEKFFDPRTGEEIDIKQAELNINDNFYKSKGRGNLLGSSSVRSFQLQKQLRLARPMGSGDEAMETFCKRNRQTDKFQPVVKASRKSSLQSNSLLNTVLSKTKEKSEAEVVNEALTIFIDAEG